MRARVSRGRRALLLPALHIMAAAACTGGGQSDAGNSRDAGDLVIGECEVGPAPASFAYPSGPYGTEVGETFEDFVLSDCDGNDIWFGDVLSRSELVLFNVGAGWCAPCIEESAKLQAEVFEPFCGRGLEVVQVLFQDQSAAPATKLFCAQWKAQYDMTFPVLVDPLFITNAYFEAVSTPLNMLVDSSGEIRFKEVGLAPEGMPERIDALLPSSDVP